MSPGPLILDPQQSRESQLTLGALIAAGLREARISTGLPERGMLLVLARLRDRYGEEAERWASAGQGRTVIHEPTSTAEQLPKLLAGQRANAPSVPPADPLMLGDAYLADLIAIALRGYSTRLDHGRPFPARWVPYLMLALDVLGERATDARTVRRYLDRFRTLPGEKDKGSAYLADRLAGLSRERPPTPQDPRRLLKHWALLVAAEDDPDAWKCVVEHLDVRRGLFRRSGIAERIAWELHPVVLCALARRIGLYQPAATTPVAFPDPPGAGPLSHAGLLNDPPDLVHSYDLSEYSIVPELVPEVLDVPPYEGSFTLSIRHDVDRELTSDDLHRHLALETRLGCKSTWYFKAETFDPEAAGILRDAGCEIGYHAEILATGDDGFLDALRTWLGGSPGMTFHGGLGGDAFRGRRSLEQAAVLGVAYAEMLIGVRRRPVLWPHEKGWLPLTPLPVKYDTFPERLGPQLDAIAVPGGMVVVENHPDLLDPGYVDLLETLVAKNPRRLTVHDAISGLFPPGLLQSLGQPLPSE